MKVNQLTTAYKVRLIVSNQEGVIFTDEKVYDKKPTKKDLRKESKHALEFFKQRNPKVDFKIEPFKTSWSPFLVLPTYEKKWGCIEKRPLTDEEKARIKSFRVTEDSLGFLQITFDLTEGGYCHLKLVDKLLNTHYLSLFTSKDTINQFNNVTIDQLNILRFKTWNCSPEEYCRVCINK